MAKVESFDGLISSIQEAFLSVNRLAEYQHLEALNEFLEDDGSPKTLSIKYPYFNDSGEVEYKSVEVPELCLIPISTLKLNEVSVDFKVKLSSEIKLKQSDGGQANNNGVLMTAGIANSDSAQAKKSKMGYIPGFGQKKDGNTQI